MVHLEKDEHVLEAIGRTRVVVRDGVVVEVGSPLIRSCPLARKFACPVADMTPSAIKENIEQRIREFGMCTDRRQICSDQDFVPFGASELISCGIRRSLLDCAVIVCDGAGTVVVTSPSMVQGIGGRMSGMVRTTPIIRLIQRIREQGGHVLSEEAVIDQEGGVALARHLGYNRIAVTVAESGTASALRNSYPDILIFGVHVTGLSVQEASALVDSCDLVTACASSAVRAAAGQRAILQAGGTVPVFALTERGKELVLERLRELRIQVLVKAEKLPKEMGEQPEPLV